jgi:hypothetical protein
LSKESPYKYREETRAVKIHHNLVQSPVKKMMQSQTTEVVRLIETKHKFKRDEDLMKDKALKI